MRIQIALLFFVLLSSQSTQAGQVIEQKTLEELVRQAEAAFNQQDFGKAYEKFDRAARWGHKGAQFVVGKMILLGKGTARDPVAAAAWLAVASEAEIRGYQEASDHSSLALSTEQKSAALKLERELRLHYGLEAAQVRCKRQRSAGSNFYSTHCQHKSAGHGLIYVPGGTDTGNIASP